MEALGSHRPDEALGEGVHLRSQPGLDRQLPALLSDPARVGTAAGWKGQILFPHGQRVGRLPHAKPP